MTGTALGSSTRVSTKLALDNTTIKSVGRRLVGDSMFYQKVKMKNLTSP